MRRTALVALTALFVGIPVSLSQAAKVPRAILKTYFETGDVPTQEQFGTLIDSMLNIPEDGFLLKRVGATPTSKGELLQRLGSGQVVDSGITFVPGATPLPVAPLWEGFSGFVPLEFLDNGGLVHYGYFQMSMEPPIPGGPAGGPIHVDYVVVESLANTPVVATEVPEPASLGLLALGGVALLSRRRRIG